MNNQSNNVIAFKTRPALCAPTSVPEPEFAKPVRVLIIDDTPEDRMVVRLALEVQGYLLNEADNGERGLAAARSIQPDCIILDHKLPDMDAEEVLAALAGPHGVMPCAVVMLMGSTNGPAAARLLHAGALDYLSKDRISDDHLRRAVDGAVDRFQLMAARRTAEARNAQLAAIIAASNDAIISIDIDRSILTWNPGAEELFGYTEAEAVGSAVDDLIVPGELQAERLQIFEVVKDGKQFARFETERHRKDGTRIAVDVTVSPMLGVRGEVTGFSVVFRDVTDRRAAEKVLREREQELVQTQRMSYGAKLVTA